ncbi:helix-turn-helix domain-containing protein [Dictyobacter formicarum]|nr:helix-turn-helix domain-containing protein [Dictyobacter formicarum]
MEKQNRMLKSARMQRAWTPEFVSGLVGVSRSTYIRWESGAQRPRHASLDALCKVFAMSPAELGFVASRMRQVHALEKPEKPADISSTLSADGMVEVDEDDTFDIAEEDLPASLATWSIGLASCWQWYMAGSQRELERLVPTYLTRLMKPTLTPGPEQKTAACLTAQAYQLIALLDLQRGDFASAQTNGTQALVYSQLAKDWNVYVAAQIRLATIFSARKRIGSALNAYNNALHRINTNNDNISPILHSWIFAGLAEIQATMGRETEALQFLKLALAVFPEKPEEDACMTYAQCDRSMLYLYQGLVFLRLGQPRLAWEAFSQVDELKPVPSERMRAEFLKYRTYTSLVLGNMIQSCIYLEAAARAARAINSDLVFSEIYVLYEHMLAIWGQEPRVKALAVLFQS